MIRRQMESPNASVSAERPAGTIKKKTIKSGNYKRVDISDE